MGKEEFVGLGGSYKQLGIATRSVAIVVNFGGSKAVAKSTKSWVGSVKQVTYLEGRGSVNAACAGQRVCEVFKQGGRAYSSSSSSATAGVSDADTRSSVM